MALVMVMGIMAIVTVLLCVMTTMIMVMATRIGSRLSINNVPFDGLARRVDIFARASFQQSKAMCQCLDYSLERSHSTCQYPLATRGNGSVTHLGGQSLPCLGASLLAPATSDH